MILLRNALTNLYTNYQDSTIHNLEHIYLPRNSLHNMSQRHKDVHILSFSLHDAAG